MDFWAGALFVFQPALRTIDGAGLGLRFSPPRVRLPALPTRADLAALADLELTVDLGNAIGSCTWWRGVATLAALTYGAITLGGHPVHLPTAMQPALLPSQISLAAPDAVHPLALGATSGAHVLPTNRVSRLAEAPERPRVEVTAKLRKSDSVSSALRRAGVGTSEVGTLTDLLSGAVALKSVRPGTSLNVVLGRRENKSVPRPLESLAFRAAFDLKIEVNRTEAGALAVKRIPIAVDNTPLRVSGRVGSSLYKAARAAGVPANLVSEAIKALSHRLDISRDVRGSDRFDIIVAHRRAETGETETGNLLYAAIDGRKDAAVMRWPLNGKSQFFLSDGSSARKGLMRTPVDGAQLTSGFGFRMHPILGYSRMHKGVDFGAGMGAPVMSAAGGTVKFAGWHGGHGNYIMVDHGKGLATAYAHLSRINVRVGERVDQGERIGLVGSTGMSTGAHLHYEVWQGGKAIDPRSAKFAAGTQLAGGELGRFKAEMGKLKRVRTGGARVAMAETKADKRA